MEKHQVYGEILLGQIGETGPERERSLPKDTQPVSGRQAARGQTSREDPIDGCLPFPPLSWDEDCPAREGPSHKLIFHSLPFSFLQLCTTLCVNVPVCVRGVLVPNVGPLFYRWLGRTARNRRPSITNLIHFQFISILS